MSIFYINTLYANYYMSINIYMCEYAYQLVYVNM